MTRFRPIRAITFAGALLWAGVAFAAAPATRDVPAQPFHAWASTPPMGWNSWDCFGSGVNERQTLANAAYMAEHLESHGWDIVTIDIQWYEPLAHTDQYRKGATVEMDANGRLLPAGNRFASTKATRSFKALADALHARGLKFGLHLLRGIPRQAVEKNVPILGTDRRAADIADMKNVCAWNTDMYGVDMSRPGAQAYYDSVFALLASWDLDFVKVDDLSAPYHTAEIEAIRQAIDRTGRRIVLSTSPGPTPISRGLHIAEHANLWRISGDFWDNWGALYAQFQRLDDWTAYRGPGHFPDADMLPLGALRTWNDKDHHTHFTRDEQITLMTLWSIARSPLILGADLPENDDFTLSLLTNDEVIAVDQHSINNHQLWRHGDQVAWVADVADSQDKYVALFNTAPAQRPRRSGATTAPPPADPAATQPAALSVSLADLGLTGPCAVRDLWSHRDLPAATHAITATVNSHGAALFRVRSRR